MIKIIAEAGINHCGRVEDAIKLVSAAKYAGADVVKFQIYDTSLLVRDIQNRDLLRNCQLFYEDYQRIKACCDDLGIEWLVSCFDMHAVDIALGLKAKTIKLGSGELVNHDLIRYIAGRKANLMLSTGMSTLDEVFRAVEAFDSWSNDKYCYERLSLLHCVSLYPTPFEHCNLKAIKTLKDNFFCAVGFSDHTVGFDAAVGAVAMGSEIIEKHIMLRPGCPDEAVSLSPENFKGYVAAIRRAEAMMGDGEKRPMPGEEEMAEKVRYRWHVPLDSEARYQIAESGERDSIRRLARDRAPG